MLVVVTELGSDYWRIAIESLTDCARTVLGSEAHMYYFFWRHASLLDHFLELAPARLAHYSYAKQREHEQQREQQK